VIAELLGVPAAHADDLRRWSQAIVRMYEVAPSEETVAAAVDAAADFAGLVRELVHERQARPQADLVSDLAAAGGLTEDEMVASVVLLLNAGHEASVNVFGNGLVAMLRRGLRPGPDVPAAVEEMLRFDSALQLFERTATEPVEVGGVTVETGQKVAVLLGSANRDPAVFDEPDEMRLDRDPNPHVAFGVGVHFCLGAPLARMELAESLSALLAARPGLELVGEPEPRGTFVLRGFRRVLAGGAG
jgi:unspecific monooxygenase